MSQTTKNLPVLDKDNMGEINITTGVLESIASQAASEVDGVLTSKSQFQREVSNLFGQEREASVANVRREGFDVTIDIKIDVQYGHSVPEVAIAVQERVKEQILFMTDLVVKEVNVHVVHILAEEKTNEYYHLEDEYAIQPGDGSVQ